MYLIHSSACIGLAKKTSFGFFHKMLQKNPNRFFGQPNMAINYLDNLLNQIPQLHSPKSL